MITDGLILMVVGMVVVFFFLLLLNVLISGLSWLLKDHALLEEKQLLEAEAAKRKKKSAKRPGSVPAAAGAEDLGRITAVISAAVHAHRNR
ncbi:MAG: OadG family protein [Chlorobiales bacterium]|nr:OadG family protein [Chlorobiales bacterium]